MPSKNAKKKKQRVNAAAKTGTMVIMTSEEATMAKKPRYNAFAGGYGAHGDKKYNRAKEKRNWKSDLNY